MSSLHNEMSSNKNATDSSVTSASTSITDSKVPSPEVEEGGMTLKRNLSLLNGVSMIIGVIVGSGIFVSPSGVASKAGSIGMSLVIWAMCGVLSMIGALCYAELGTAIPQSGGDYAYIREAFGSLPAFLFLWVALFIIMPGGNAIAALTIAEYALSPFYSMCGDSVSPERARQLVAAIAICFLTFVNCYSVKWATLVQNSLTFSKVIALLIIILAGFWHMIQGNVQNFENMWEGTETSPFKLAVGFYSGLFTYAGWNYLNFMTEELKDPYTNLPRAIYISIPTVTIIYLLTNLAYFSTLTVAGMTNSKVVAISFTRVAINWITNAMPLLVSLSAFGGLNGGIFASSRLLFIGARNGHLPNFLAMININYFTPIPSLIFLGLLTLLYLIIPDILVLINYTAFIESLFSTMSVAALLWLRYKRPDLERPIRVNLIFPIIFLVVCSFLLVLPFFEDAKTPGIAVLITLAGIPVYFATIYWESKPTWIISMFDGLTKFVQKCLITIGEDEGVEPMKDK